MTPRHAILDVNHEVFPALLVLYGDVGVFVGNGVVQSAADTLLLPLAASQPELFTQSQVLSAQWQGIALAALWAGFTMALNGYRPSTTRTLPSRPAFIPSAPPGSDRASFSFPRVQGLGYHSRLRPSSFLAAPQSSVGGDCCTREDCLWCKRLRGLHDPLAETATRTARSSYHVSTAAELD